MLVMFRIVEDDMPPLPEDCSDLLQDFLGQCFYKDPELRPDAETLCEHPWLTSSWEALKVYFYDLTFLRKGSSRCCRNSVHRIAFHSFVVSALIIKGQM